MTWLTSVSRQIYGLFVEDGALSVSICVWLLFVWFVLPHVAANASVRPIVLFMGLAILLADSVRRATTQNRVEHGRLSRDDAEF